MGENNIRRMKIGENENKDRDGEKWEGEDRRK